MDYGGFEVPRNDNSLVSTPRTPRRLLARENMASGLLQSRYLQPQHVWQWKRESTDDSLHTSRAVNRSRPSTMDRSGNDMEGPTPRRRSARSVSNNGSLYKHSNDNGHVGSLGGDWSPRPVSSKSATSRRDLETAETVKIMKFSELNRFLRENEKKKSAERRSVRISFHDFPYIKIKLQRCDDESGRNGLLEHPLVKKESNSKIDAIFNPEDVHFRDRGSQVPPSQRISSDVARALQMAKLPPAADTQTFRRSSVISSDNFPALNSVKTDSRTVKSNKHGRVNKRVHFEQKWIFDDGKYYFSESPNRCK